MHALTLTLGRHSFPLRGDADVAELEAQLTDAVKSGGGIVSLPLAEQSTVHALVTPGMFVTIEGRRVDREIRSGGGPRDADGWELSWLDLELGA